MDDTPNTPANESFEQMAKRLGVEIETGGGSTVTFLGPKGTAAMRKLIERQEPEPDECE